jgi:Hypothetical glycosyl hydrolase 6/Beta-galactosidase trimerisation domain
MANSSNRWESLRKGTILLASGLVIPGSAAANGEPPVPAQAKLSAKRRTKPSEARPGATSVSKELERFAEESSGEVARWHEWWSNNFLRVDFDMLMTDASPEAISKIDPEFIAATIADAGLQALWGYIQDESGWLYYPSKVGQQFPGLKGRDLVGEYVAACRKHGLKFLGYFDPMEMGVEVTRHPEWRNEYPGDRVPSSPRLWGKLCYNRPGSLDFMLRLLRESLTNYEMDAVWFDEFWVEGCGCADCQKRYKEETGRELPFYFNQPQMVLPNVPDRPEYGYYFYQIQKWLDGWTMAFRRTVKEVRPECIVLFQYVGYGGRSGPDGYTVNMAEAADVITRDCWRLANQFQHSIEFKSVRSFTRYLPFDAELPIGEHHADEVSPKQEDLLKQQYAYVLAHGGAISYIDDMDWEGRISDKKYERMKRVNEWARSRFPYLGGVMVADVGLYLSQESNTYHPKWHHFRWHSPRGDAECGTEFSIHNAGNVALVQAMIREKIPFDAVHRNKLKELSRHKVMYMNNVEVLRDEEAEALREFVRAGGGLVITHRTGLRDEQYQERKNFALAEVMGVDYLETPDIASSFVIVEQDDRAEGFFSDVGTVMPYFEADCPQCYVKPRPSAIRLGKIACPKRPYLEDGFPAPDKPPVMQLIDPQEIRQANAGYRYDPEILTGYPAVVLNRFGKGRVAYCAAYPSYDYIDNIHNLILALVNWAAGGRLEATVTSNAPGPVEIITMEQLNKNRTIVHAINWQPNWPGVVAHNVEVTIKTFGRRARKAFAIEAKTDVRLKGEVDRLRATFPPVNAWETMVIEWA